MKNCLNGCVSAPPTTSSNKISPVCILINGGAERHKLAGLMGPTPLKYHMSDSGGNRDGDAEQGWGGWDFGLKMEKLHEKE